jgi:hypothetical protein
LFITVLGGRENLGALFVELYVVGFLLFLAQFPHKSLIIFKGIEIHVVSVSPYDINFKGMNL